MRISITRQILNTLPLVAVFSFVACTGVGGRSAPLNRYVDTPNFLPSYAFTANASDNSVSTYAVDGSTGQLKYVGKVSTGATPRFVTAHPSGKFVYVVNAIGTISQSSIDAADGALTPVGPGTIAAGAFPVAVTVDPSGKYAYVANLAGNSVSQYAIDKNGALHAMHPAAVVDAASANSVPFSIAVTSGITPVPQAEKSSYASRNSANNVN